MADALKRSFQVNDYIYVVDYWGAENGTQAFETRAEILKVDEKAETFIAVLYGDTYQRYSFQDYGRLFFDTSEEATEAANNLPKPKSIAYQVIGKRVYKKTVIGIGGRLRDKGIYDLVICLDKGKDVSTKEVGCSLFLNESDARNSFSPV